MGEVLKREMLEAAMEISQASNRRAHSATYSPRHTLPAGDIFCHSSILPLPAPLFSPAPSPPDVDRIDEGQIGVSSL